MGLEILDDDWPIDEVDKRIYSLECAFCKTKMTRAGFLFSCPNCGCECNTDEQGNTTWDTHHFKYNPYKLASYKQRRAIWICNTYGGHNFFTLRKEEATAFLSKYFEEACAMKELLEEEENFSKVVIPETYASGVRIKIRDPEDTLLF